MRGTARIPGRGLRGGGLATLLLAASSLWLVPASAADEDVDPVVLTATVPASPSADTSPKVIGLTPFSGSDHTVYLYVNDPTCAGPPAASGSPYALKHGGISVHVSPGQTIELRATITYTGNSTPPCSAPIFYTTLAPASPLTLIGTSPVSPSVHTTIRVIGATGLSGASHTANLYVNDPTCAGPPAATGKLYALKHKGIRVQVPPARTSELRGTVTPGLNGASACSAPLFYTALPPPSPGQSGHRKNAGVRIPTQPLPRVLRRGLFVWVNCRRACRARGEAILGASQARRWGLGARTRRIGLYEGRSFRTGWFAMRIRFTAGVRRRLARAGRVKIQLRVGLRDKSGAAETLRRAVLLRNQRRR